MWKPDTKARLQNDGATVWSKAVFFTRHDGI